MSERAYQNPDVIRSALKLKNVAIVGLSAKELRASNFVGRYMRYHGYTVIPVNPQSDEILGLPSNPTLLDVPGPVDIVNVFRLSEAVPEIAAEAVSIGAKCLWLQFGVISEEGATFATERGMDVVMDRCIKIEHARYLGRMHWVGLNTGRISARRERGGS
jgi:predicted CoA-binding protein